MGKGYCKSNILNSGRSWQANIGKLLYLKPNQENKQNHKKKEKKKKQKNGTPLSTGYFCGFICLQLQLLRPPAQFAVWLPDTTVASTAGVTTGQPGWLSDQRLKHISKYDKTTPPNELTSTVRYCKPWFWGLELLLGTLLPVQVCLPKTAWNAACQDNELVRLDDWRQPVAKRSTSKATPYMAMFQVEVSHVTCWFWLHTLHKNKQQCLLYNQFMRTPQIYIYCIIFCHLSIGIRYVVKPYLTPFNHGISLLFPLLRFLVTNVRKSEPPVVSQFFLSLLGHLWVELQNLQANHQAVPIHRAALLWFVPPAFTKRSLFCTLFSQLVSSHNLSTIVIILVYIYTDYNH